MVEQKEVTKRSKHKAGGDPAKREQILHGAKVVFSRVGFDAASMNDITREAGVSKGTVYVYFPGKYELFEALIEYERVRIFTDIEQTLTAPGSLAERLHAFGSRLVTLLCSEEVVNMQRMVIGICERKPEIGARFFASGALRGQQILSDFMTTEMASGVLRKADPEVMAQQFMSLSIAGLLRHRLYGHLPIPPSATLVKDTVTAAVDTFLRAHLVNPADRDLVH